MKRYLTTAILLLMACMAGFAQQQIVKMMDNLERKENVNSTYTERRNNKRELYRTTRILEFNDKSYYTQLAKAFEAERPNTTSAIKTNDTYSYKFENNKGSYSFTLSPNRIILIWRSSKCSDEDGTNVYSTTVNINGNDICTTVHSFDAMEQAFDVQNQVFEAQRQAFEAQNQAFEARKQAEQARKDAEQARKNAEKARKNAEKARKQSGSSSYTTYTYVY